jgi:hypothetical protein
MTKRKLFAALMQGVDDMTAQRQGKIKLRSNDVESKPVLEAISQYRVEGQDSGCFLGLAGEENSCHR